jgi:tetratricopeptide (TPR) repeat protein
MWLLDIDIKALAELTESLLDCYRGLNDYQSFEHDLERLRGNISDVRWQRKITYFQVIASLGDHWSEKVGKREVKKLLPLDEESDTEIIQLYLHFCSEELTFKRNIDILDRLVSLIEKPSEKLQYTVVKAIKYLCIGDESESEKLIEQALNDYELKGWRSDNSYGHMQHARAISLLADLQHSAKLKVQSIQEFESLLENHSWTDSGIADIHFEIGKSLFHIKKFEEAIKQYKKSLEIQKTEIVKVFMSQALLDLNDEGAISTIKEVEHNLSELSESERLDYIFTYAAIGIAFKQKDMIEKSLGYLNDISPLAPVFEKHKSNLVSEISVLYKTGELEEKSNLMSTLKKLFRLTTRYLILQPNIAGLGVNINKMADDLVSESNKIKQSDA